MSPCSALLELYETLLCSDYDETLQSILQTLSPERLPQLTRTLLRRFRIRTKQVSKKPKVDVIVFFLPCTILMLYDDVLTMEYHRELDVPEGHTIRAHNQIVPLGMKLGCEKLRKLFTLIELLVLKCVEVNEQAGCRLNFSNYHQYLDHLEKKRGLITSDQREILIALHDTRCEFAHTIQDVEKLRYRGSELRTVFRSGRLGQSSFLSDAYNASQILLNIFIPKQREQIDHEGIYRWLSSDHGASL